MSLKAKVNHARIKIFLSWFGITSDNIIRLWEFLKPYFTGFVLVMIGMLVAINLILGIPEYRHLKEYRKTTIVFHREDIGVAAPAVALASTEQTKEAAKKVDQASSPAIQTIKRISKEEGVDPKMVQAINILESGFGKKMEGDGGLSKGWYHIYHINTCEYKQTDTCIKSEDRMDLEKSTRWTARRLKVHEVLGEHEQIRSHNGLIADHSNDGYVDHVKRLMANI